jgi:hypothetical protein
VVVGVAAADVAVAVLVEAPAAVVACLAAAECHVGVGAEWRAVVGCRGPTWATDPPSAMPEAPGLVAVRDRVVVRGRAVLGLVQISPAVRRWGA